MRDKSPAWRVILEWGCVAYFLGIPLIVLVTVFTPIEANFEKYPNARENLQQFHVAVSALVMAIAGLNTVDRKIANGSSVSVDDPHRSRFPKAPPPK